VIKNNEFGKEAVDKLIWPNIKELPEHTLLNTGVYTTDQDKIKKMMEALAKDPESEFEPKRIQGAAVAQEFMDHPERFDEEYLWQLQQWTTKEHTSPNQGVLARSRPHHLEELRIIDCKVHQAGSELLFDFLNDKSCFISKFSYVNGNLNDNGVRHLFNFIQQNKHLRELDVSNNQLNSSQMY
jgi:hypothetical protein